MFTLSFVLLALNRTSETIITRLIDYRDGAQLLYNSKVEATGSIYLYN